MRPTAVRATRSGKTRVLRVVFHLVFGQLPSKFLHTVALATCFQFLSTNFSLKEVALQEIPLLKLVFKQHEK